MIWFAVAIAGGSGASTRFVVDHLVTSRLASRFPWGTWFVNVTGSFLAGLVTGLALAEWAGPELHVVLAGGFLGAYTTFSTAMLQAVAQVEAGRSLHAFGNLVGTVVAALGAAGLGLGLALRLVV
jgi:fluoride exporter